jgi:hypothetical protein
MLVAVPTDEAIKFKDKYSVQFEDATKMSGILRRSTGDTGYLYIEYGSGPSEPTAKITDKKKKVKHTNKQYIDDYYELLIEEYVGKKITLQATSATLDKSDRLDHINSSKVFIVNTPNDKIKGGQIAVVVPDKLVSGFSKTFMKNKRNKRSKPQNLSGYLYKHETKKTSFLYLYCSNEPLDLDVQKPVVTQDYLHELIAIYMDLDDDGKDELIELARELDSPK